MTHEIVTVFINSLKVGFCRLRFFFSMYIFLIINPIRYFNNKRSYRLENTKDDTVLILSKKVKERRGFIYFHFKRVIKLTPIYKCKVLCQILEKSRYNHRVPVHRNGKGLKIYFAIYFWFQCINFV